MKSLKTLEQKELLKDSKEYNPKRAFLRLFFRAIGDGLFGTAFFGMTVLKMKKLLAILKKTENYGIIIMLLHQLQNYHPNK